MTAKHKWTFFRAGGFDQVKLETGEDLMNLASLDQKLWVALACPTNGLEIDARTLELIDSDKNGRVRVNELIAAVKFAGQNVKNADDLLKGGESLPLASIQDGTAEGKTLLSSAKQILHHIGKADAKEISVEDVSDKGRIFANTAFNGDGIITEVSAEDEATRQLVREILDCVGSEMDLTGKPGIHTAKIEAFFAEVKAYGEWHARAEAEAATIWPLGQAKTAEAAAAVAAVKRKVDDYFGRCRLAAFDGRTAVLLNRKEEEYQAIAGQDLSFTVTEVASFPLAAIAADKPLPLGSGINPAHAAAMAELVEKAITPLLGARKELSESDWLALLAKIAPYQAWEAQKACPRVEKLGHARLLEIAAGQGRETLSALIVRDLALEAEFKSIEQVEKLVRYYRDLRLLCTNFVNFKDFYDGSDPAIFQCGTLYLDQRACRLCMRVQDAGKHAVMAGLAGAYLAYLDCVSKSTAEKMQIVAAFTSGDSDNLMVGRNGLFYDRKGQDWDATIVKIVDNPISIGQAFWSPYKKFVRYLEEQVNKRAAAAEADSHSNLAATAETAVNVDKTKPPAVPKKLDVGTVAAIGVAAGAIGTFFTALVGYAAGIFKLGILPTIGALIGVMLLISTPSVIMAYMKLRKRNLGPILDANGWAVNAKAKINVPFGATLSSTAKLPPGSRRDSSDPYAEKGLPWKRLAAVAFVLYGAYRYYTGSLDRVLPASARSIKVLGQWSPKAEKAPEAAPAPAAAKAPETPAPASTSELAPVPAPEAAPAAP